MFHFFTRRLVLHSISESFPAKKIKIKIKKINNAYFSFVKRQVPEATSATKNEIDK